MFPDIPSAIHFPFPMTPSFLSDSQKPMATLVERLTREMGAAVRRVLEVEGIPEPSSLAELLAPGGPVDKAAHLIAVQALRPPADG